jgi:ABC-2 type transport system permease protein
MRAYWTLTRRELAMYFMSLSGYVIIAASVFLLGMSFVYLLTASQKDATMTPVTEMFYGTWFFWLILLLTVPVITMRLFALEKSSGTFEALMTAPVSDLAVVLSKFTAALVFFLVMWLPLLACLAVVRYFSNDRSVMDPGVVGSTYLGIFLLGALFVSVGCCTSAMTRSQVIAAVLSLAFCMGIFFVAYLADSLSEQTTWDKQVLSSLALIGYMHDFSRGIVDTQPIVLLVSLTFFFLFLTLRIVESRRWK